MGTGLFHCLPLTVDFFLPGFLPLYPQEGTGFVFSLGIWQSGSSQRPFPGTKPLGNDRSPQDFSRPGRMLKLRSTGPQIGQQLCIRIGSMFSPEFLFPGFQRLCHHLPDGTFVNIMSSCVSHVSTFHTFVFFVCLETKKRLWLQDSLTAEVAAVHITQGLFAHRTGTKKLFPFP